MVIDCGTCVMSGPACGDCVVTVLLGTRGGRGTLSGPERLGSVGFGSPIATRQRGIPDGLDPGLRPFLSKMGSP